jgi:hypothetical protein
LNALTSPHAFLGGNVALYDAHRWQAERALALVALSLCCETVITLPDATRAVTQTSTGASGKDFLGYTASIHLESELRCGLARLAAEGLVRELDGVRFAYDPAALRTALMQLRDHTVAGRNSIGAPGTIV